MGAAPFHPTIAVSGEVGATASFLPCCSGFVFCRASDASVERPFLLCSRGAHMSAALLQPTPISGCLVSAFTGTDPLGACSEGSRAFDTGGQIPFQFDGLHMRAAVIQPSISIGRVVSAAASSLPIGACLVSFCVF
nr:hypothetical protein [Vibrio campbellii]